MKNNNFIQIANEEYGANTEETTADLITSNRELPSIMSKSGTKMLNKDSTRVITAPSVSSMGELEVVSERMSMV